MNHRSVQSALLATLFLLTSTAFAGRFDNAGLAEPEVQAAFNTIQTALAKDDAASLATLVSYPLQINKTKVTNAAGFVKAYPGFANATWKKAVLAQRYATLISNQNGVMVGEAGQIWLSGVCTDKQCSQHHVKIIAINP